MVPLFVFVLMFIAVMPAWAATPTTAVDPAAYSVLLGEELFCNTARLLSGYDTQIALFVGLALAAVGVLQMVYQGWGKGPLILIAGGLIFTSLPGLFMTGLASLESVYGGSGGVKSNNGIWVAGCKVSGASPGGGPGLSTVATPGGAAVTPSGTATGKTDVDSAITAAETGGGCGATLSSRYACDHGNGAYGLYGFRETTAKFILKDPNLKMSDFLADPALQNKAYDALKVHHRTYKSDKYYEPTRKLVEQVYGASGASADAITLAVMHAEGIAGGKKCLSSGKCGNDINAYLRRGGLIK